MYNFEQVLKLRARIILIYFLSCSNPSKRDLLLNEVMFVPQISKAVQHKSTQKSFLEKSFLRFIAKHRGVVTSIFICDGRQWRSQLGESCSAVQPIIRSSDQSDVEVSSYQHVITCMIIQLHCDHCTPRSSNI